MDLITRNIHKMRIYINRQRVLILVVAAVSALTLTLIYKALYDTKVDRVKPSQLDAAVEVQGKVPVVDESEDYDELSEHVIKHRKKIRSEDLFPIDSQFSIRLKSSTARTDASDAFHDLLIKNNSPIMNTRKGKVCKEKWNYVFVKTMKCATQTLVQILRRFGYLRRLNFVLPRRKNIYLGWPFITEPQDYRPSKRKFNALVEHAVYNKTVMSKLLPGNTFYISIIREPFSQFKSIFNYFNVAKISRVTVEPGQSQITEYIRGIDKYESFYKSREGSKIRYCVPDGFSVTKNILSHCLGMPLGFPEGRKNITLDATAVAKYINDLDNDMKLVMIMEYFHESLVLLKRLMCWSLKDIVYRSSNLGSYSYKHSKPSSEELNFHKHWSSVDYQLYDHFNKTFWSKIAQEGEEFHQEVNTFTGIQKRVSQYCDNIPKNGESLHVIATAFSDDIVISPSYCLVLGVDLLAYIRTRYDGEEYWTETEDELAVPKRCC